MQAAAVAHLVAAVAYAGFQWTVRVVVYPQLATAAAADPDGFPALEAAHTRRVSLLVGPLFAALVATTGWLVVSRPASAPAWVCAAATAVVLGATALGAVPQHRALSAGWDPVRHRRLLRWDDVRVLAATVQAVCAVVLVAGWDARLPG